MALIGSIQVISGEHFHFIKVNLSENILVTKSRFIGINSTMVRLIPTSWDCFTSFRRTVVLKDFSLEVPIYRDQFHNGSIKTNSIPVLYAKIIAVSIPQWFD